MKKTLKNAKMMEMLYSLKPLLDHRDKIGYVAARNVRALEDTLTEFIQFRDELIDKYGSPVKDEEGNDTPVYVINSLSPNFKMFREELAPFEEMEHDVEIMKAKYSDVEGCLTGAEILSVDWMLED